MRLSFFLAGLVMFGLAIVSCEEDPTSVGSNLLPGDDLIEFYELDSYADSITQQSMYFKDNIFLGQSERILLGKSDGLKATALMRFFIPITVALGELIDSNNINILSSKVILKPYYSFGDTLGTFDFSVYEVNSFWTVDSFSVDSLEFLDYEQEDEVQNLSVSDSLISFNVDPEMIFSWMKAELDSSIANPNGFLFKPSETTERIFGFRAYGPSNLDDQAEIEIVYEVPGEYTDTLLATLNSDVHVVEGDLSETADDIMVLQGGIGARGQIKFDLGSIPLNSIISDAELTLTIDTLSSETGNIDQKSLSVYVLKEYESNYALDTLGFFNMIKEGDIFRGKVTRFVQRWFYDEEVGGMDNQGLMIRLGEELESVNKYVVYGSTQADPLLRPRLKVIYSSKL